MIDIAWRLLVVLLLVGLNAFFVAAEFALVSVRRTRIEQLAAEGNMLARIVRRALADPNRFISAAQLGITMASLGLGWVGEPTLARLIGPALESVLPERIVFITSHGLAIFFAFTLITLFHLVLGEQVPKMLALQRAEPVILATAQVTELVSIIFRPFIWVVYWATELVLRPLGLRYEGERHLVYTVEELEMLVTASAEGGQLDESEQEMIHRVFNFADLTAHQVMVPRTEIVGVPADVTLPELTALVAREGRSRFPVYRGTIDEIVGIVYVKDIFRALRRDQGEPFDIREITREALIVPESRPVDELLADMKARRVHMAIVIDEFGGTAGLLTLEDILEVIVGEMQDEFERPETDIEVAPDGSASVNGLVLIGEFNRRLGTSIDDPNFDTIGGFVFGQIGRKPEINDEIVTDGLRLRVSALDGLRIARLIVERVPETEVADTPD
ncbi:MAG: HlyC/CorC family transporter [Thermomicrobiales bacterium]|nr:HlyC/CorC family transporter [Thermomicrobiales bacterium]